VILKDHAPSFPACFVPVLLSARSLKITKVDCRQESAGSIIEFPIAIYLCRATMRRPTTKRRGEGTETHHSLCRASCEAAQLLAMAQTETSLQLASEVHVEIAKTPKTYHTPSFSVIAGVFVGHLMENSSGRASEWIVVEAAQPPNVYFPSHRPEGKSPVVLRDRPSFKRHARGEGSDGRSGIRGRK